MTKSCVICKMNDAAACDECRRALALFAEHMEPPMVLTSDNRVIHDPDWNPFLSVITRHPESGTDCGVCRRGEASLCTECLLDGALEHRLRLRAPVRTSARKEMNYEQSMEQIR